MTHEELEQAEAQLSRFPEYNWLTLSPQSWFNMGQVATGLGVSRPTVKGWCESGQIPGAINYGAEISWRMPRSGLVEFIMNLRKGSGLAM